MFEENGNQTSQEERGDMSGHVCTHLKFKVKPVSPANTEYILKVIFFSGLFGIAKTVLHIQFYILLFIHLVGQQKHFPKCL